ncbi:MAG TPA: glucosaminidase domain-containing protein [Terriglobales bacterium]|nr:glucosaminidase domain-containing protein [Terriglobales bacterium]
MNDLQKQFLDRATAEAVKANHPFPQMASCEAALESTWGHSELAREANNLFGMKRHQHNIYGVLNLPTREWSAAKGWTQVPGVDWEKYPDWRACFCDRLATLQKLSNAYPHYKAALDATDAKTYIISVSETWSTDPGWPCSCGENFIAQEDANVHAHSLGAGHGIGAAVPGLGRAMKVWNVYRDFVPAPSAPTDLKVT